MRKLFSSRRRVIGLGLMSALVIALAVLGSLWGSSSHTASANSVPVVLRHVEPDGSDYTGNPYCPDTTWTGTRKPVVNPWHDCNNITSQNHVIRTDSPLPDTVGWTANYAAPTWNIENFSGATATIQAQGRCGDIALVTSRIDWDTANDDERCVVIHSSTPGETRVTLTFTDNAGTPTDPTDDTIFVTPPVVKEWDSLGDSVILKYGDLEKVKVYYDADGDTVIESGEYVEMYLPLDVNGDGKRDVTDEHLLDKQSKWQDHAVVWDEALKRIKSSPPVQIIEVVHGQHNVLINSVSITTYQPTEGALVLAEIESPRNCTFFTDAAGSIELGRALELVTDNLGRVEVYVDTVCEEQAEVHFYDQYPNLPGSLRLGLHEWVGINWTTIELAKQPQIRWAGEEIVLAKRWALPDEWYPNKYPSPSTQIQPPCPLATVGGAVYSDEDGDGELMDTVVTHHVNGVLLDPGLGALEGGYVDMDGDGVLDSLIFSGQSEAIGFIDDQCISKFLASSENPGQQDIEAKLMEDVYFCEPYAMGPIDNFTAATGSPPVAGEIYFDSVAGGFWCDYGLFYAPADLIYSYLINKHAFLVWYLKIYQVKLTNVDGERASHNDGAWTFGDGADTESDTLNVSADTLLRVTVKGWFFGGNKSAHGAVCIDMDGDGDGLDNDGDTLFGEDPDDDVDNDGDTKVDEDLEAGVPYPIPSYEAGCPDSADEMLDNGHWVLPDDLPLLAGPDAIHTRPNWDVMSEPDAAKTTAIGPKNALDSHDAVLRIWVGAKTVVPDGAISAADAIMPPLKIRASIASGDAGFLKEALKGVIYPSTNDYNSVMIPASWEIPAVVNNGGYDWMSWTMPSCTDVDDDGVCDDVDLCVGVKDPTNADTDGDTIGDACGDPDTDGDTILDDGDDSGTIGDNPCINGDTTLCDDNCRFMINATQADADSDGIGTLCDTDDTTADGATQLDSDGDTVVDALDNCLAKKNDTQLDTDNDGFGDACDWIPGLPYYETPAVPYPFWTILNKYEREDTSEADPALKKRPWYIEFYTDNRGEGMFFANGDFNLGYDDCRTDPVSGAPDCRPADVVGSSTIAVIGDYPYFRKHSAVLSNPVEKTWEWGGFKDVEAVRIDANHTAIIAHLVDRDGFCKLAVKDNPTTASGVTFSPSLHPVQGEEIEFILNTDVGRIIEVSPDGVYSAAHIPLGKASVVRLEDGLIVNRSEAVALAEDGRVLGYFDEARGIDEGLVAEEDCQAWIVIEHPLGEEPNVSVRFHDPEGVILRHWPPSELIVSLVQGWNDSCYVGPEATVEDAMADIIDDVLAVYRFTADQTWERYFPGHCEDAEGLCTIETIKPYDQLFILMAASAEWTQLIQVLPTSVDLAGASATDDVPGAWNSVCYAGADKATEEAIRDIESGVVIMYQLGSDQAWRRYVPARPEIPDTLTTLHRFDSAVLLVITEGGITWVFDP
jgi:hypothetical protein